jgi:hypothetical protein
MQLPPAQSEPDRLSDRVPAGVSASQGEAGREPQCLTSGVGEPHRLALKLGSGPKGLVHWSVVA